MTLNPSGLCMCGCGEPAPLAPVSRRDRGWVRGEPLRYIAGHHNRTRKGPKAPRWKGGRYKTVGGYIMVYDPQSERHVAEHRLIAERNLKRPLKSNEVAHHINGIKDDNRPENIVVLKHQSDHAKLHKLGKNTGLNR